MTDIEIVVRYYWHWFKCKVLSRQVMAKGMALYKLKSLEKECSEKKAECVIGLIDDISTKLQAINNAK